MKSSKSGPDIITSPSPKPNLSQMYDPTPPSTDMEKIPEEKTSADSQKKTTTGSGHEYAILEAPHYITTTH